jgi:hypothetical protein
MLASPRTERSLQSAVERRAPTDAELVATFKGASKPQPTSEQWWMGQLIPRDRPLREGEAATIAAEIKRRVRRARVLQTVKSLGLALGGVIVIALLVGLCTFRQIACQDRLHAQGVPLGDERMDVCFN